MKTIKFTDEELSLLRQMYQDEISNAEKYIAQIKNVIKKLGGITENESSEKEPVAKRRGRKPKVKEIVPKIPKKRGRKPKSEVVSEIVSSLIDAQINAEPKVPKKRGRKPKAVVVESQVPKKAGRPKSVPTDGNTPLIVANEPKRRGRKKKEVVAEPKVTKKRGRPFKVASVPTSETLPIAAAKRGRKPRIAVVATSESEPEPTPKEENKIFKKRSPYRKTRKWRGVRLTPLSKPIILKEHKEEPVDEIIPLVETAVPPVQEINIPPTEEPKE